MKKSLNILFFLPLFLLAIFCQPAVAQESKCKLKLDASADIMSRYIWRGKNLGGSSPSIQPTFELGCGNLAVGAWGAYNFGHGISKNGIPGSSSYAEADLYASYTIADLFNITATDYFLPSDEDTAVGHYFNYKKDETGHLFEISAKYLGTEGLPLSVMVATNVYGADTRKANGDLQYSTYVELGYSFAVNTTECSAFLGFTPNKPDADKGETGFYGTSPGVVNLGITANKEIQVTEKYSLPVNVSLITNPQAENVFIVFGISL